ncbi:hypothetical protein FEM48_Zijuj05G0156800 [Ziziphus jujuba var. spinosa]|uniref:Uncharacterized protein n=1 Tax=Ziziphus jujuba var. spinosa TaxID=714518 RepID=A0A978VFN8_ZIZJJ|nr:hypothetical protein FEM48_Zijuj05G0156800 [Ziziphus jujuba var. spinosa]
MSKLFKGLVERIRAQPLNIPGSAYHHACQACLGDVVSLVVAGYKSTSLVQIWAVHFLAKYPEVLKKLQEENMGISKNKTGDFITYDDNEEHWSQSNSNFTVTFENIGKLFVSSEPGPLLETVSKLFQGLVEGIRAQPLNIPASAYHHGRQVCA